MRLLQPLTDICFGSLHHLLDSVASRLKYKTSHATDWTKLHPPPWLSLVLRLRITSTMEQNEKFLANNTIKNLHTINKMA